MPDRSKFRSNLLQLLLVISPIPALYFNFSLALLLFIPAMAGAVMLWFAEQRLLLIASLILGIVFASLIFSIYAGIFYLIGFAMPAVLTNYLFKRGTKFSTSFIIGSLPALIGVLTTYLLYQQNFALLINDYFAELKIQVTNTISAPLLNNMYSQAEINSIFQSLEWSRMAMVTLMPSILISSALTFLLCGFLLGVWLIDKAGYFSVGMKHFTLWKMSEWTLIPTGLAALLVLVNWQFLPNIGYNLLYFSFILFTICGLSLLEFQLRKAGFSRQKKILIYVLLFLTQFIAALILPLVALFDAHFDFRKVRAKQIG